MARRRQVRRRQVRRRQAAENPDYMAKSADDTVVLLKNAFGMRRLWQLLHLWEAATGMRFNEDKTEGLRCGALKKRAADPLFRSVKSTLQPTPNGI